MRKVRFPWWIVVLAVFLAALPLFLPSPTRYESPASDIPDEVIAAASANVEQFRKDFLEARITSYHESAASLTGVLLLQAALLGVSFVLVVRPASELKVPVVEINLSGQILRYAVPGALLALWLRFGFSLDRAIGDRIYCWEIINRVPTPTRVVLQATVPLRDGGFLDFWFQSFDPERSGFDADGVRRAAVAGIGFLTVGLILGMSHGAILGLIHLGNHELDGLLGRLGKATLAYVVLVIAASYYLFSYSGGAPNYFFVPVSTVALVVLGGVIKLANVARLLPPTTHSADSSPT